MSEKRELTKEEKKKMIEYYHEGCAIGMATHDTGYDENVVEAAITEIYRMIGLNKPLIIWGDSPIDCIRKKKLLAEEPMEESAIRNEAVSDCWFGQHEIYWIQFYRFCTEVLGVKYDAEDEKKLYLWYDIAKNCNWWYPYDGAVFISRKPLAVNIEAAREFEIDNEKAWDIYQLHCDTGPAVEFPDIKLYSIHGVQVPEWLVETPAEKLDANKIKDIQNAEVRREFVRKIGVERIYEALGGKTLDSEVVSINDGTGMKEIKYELVTLTFGDKRDRPYLKMINPSIDTYHLEGVPPNTKTVREALKWRNWGVDTLPEVLT